MGEEFARIFTWPFDKMLIPEQDTSDPGTPEVDTGTVSAPEIDEQSQQRKLARLSRYLTSSGGVFGTSTGSAGIN